MPSDFTLLDRHPVLRRLSGQIIWNLFEEYEVAPEAIDAFLRLYEETRRHVADTLRMADAKKAPNSCVIVQLSRRHNLCPACTAMEGIHIPLEHPHLAELLPPYGLGCAAFIRPEVVPPSQTENPGTETKSLLYEPKITSKLLCGEWIFAYPWLKEGA
jgi:hypothetical protein